MPRSLLPLLLVLLGAAPAKPEAEAAAEVAVTTTCPRRCACYVPSEVHCTFRSLRSLPSGIPRHVERINLGFNTIRTLPAAALAGMTKLELLLLHGNEIEEIPDGALADLGALQVLKLSYNRLRAVTPGALRGAWRLVRLHLDHNRLVTLDPEALLGLTSLRLLQLEGNALHRLRPGTLATFDLSGDPGLGVHFRVSTLRHLYLGGNALTSLPPMLLPAAPLLETLALQGNPWACDCIRARWLRDWAAGIRGVLRCRKDKAQEGGACATCSSPAHFRSRELRTLTEDDVSCARLVLSSPLRGTENSTLGDDVTEDDVTDGAVPAPWRLSLNLTDEHSNRVALACDAAPRAGRALTDVHVNQSKATGAAERAGLRVEATVTLDLVCVAAPGDDAYGRVWRLLAYYSDFPVEMTVHPEVPGARPEVPGPRPEAESRTGSYAQDASEQPLYFTGVRAQVTATPAWFLRPRFRLRLDRKRTSASLIRLIYETPVAETILPGRAGYARGDDVTPWVAIDLDDPEADAAIAVEGAEARLACNVIAAPGAPVSLQWRLPGGSLVVGPAAVWSRGDDVTQSETPRVFAGRDGSLHFRPAQREDSGLYICSARVGAAEDLAARRLVVTSREADGGDVITVRRSPGEALTLLCDDATGSAVALGWVLPGGRLLLRPRRAENTSLGGGGASVGPDGSLSIPRLRAADAGDFRCLAAGPAGQDEFTVRVALGDDIRGDGDREGTETSGMRPDAADFTRNTGGVRGHRKSRPGRRKLRLRNPDVEAEGRKPDVALPLTVSQKSEQEVAFGAAARSLEPDVAAPAEHRGPEVTTSANTESLTPEVGTTMELGMPEAASREQRPEVESSAASLLHHNPVVADPVEPGSPEEASFPGQKPVVGSPRASALPRKAEVASPARRGFEPRRRQRVHVTNPRVHPERWAHILARVRGRNLPGGDVTPATPTASADTTATQLLAETGNPEVTAEVEVTEEPEPEVTDQEEGHSAPRDITEAWIAGSDVTIARDITAVGDITTRASGPQYVAVSDITFTNVTENVNKSNVTEEAAASLEEAESESTESPLGFQWLAPPLGRGFVGGDITGYFPGPTLPAGHRFRFPSGSDSDSWSQGLGEASITSRSLQSRPLADDFQFPLALPARKNPGRRKWKGWASIVTSGSEATTSGYHATPTSNPVTTVGTLPTTPRLAPTTPRLAPTTPRLAPTTPKLRQGLKRMRKLMRNRDQNRDRLAPHPTSGPLGSPGTLLRITDGRLPVPRVPATPVTEDPTLGQSRSRHHVTTVTSEPKVVTALGGATASAAVHQVLEVTSPTFGRGYAGGGRADTGSGVPRVSDVTTDLTSPSEDVMTGAVIDASSDITTGALVYDSPPTRPLAPAANAAPQSTSISTESPMSGPEAPPPPSSVLPTQAPPLTGEPEASRSEEAATGVHGSLSLAGSQVLGPGVTVMSPRTSRPVSSTRQLEVTDAQAQPLSTPTTRDPQHRFSGAPSPQRLPPWDELPRPARPLPFPGGSLRFTLPHMGVTRVIPGPPLPVEVPHSQGHGHAQIHVDLGPPGERPRIVTKSPNTVVVAADHDATLHCWASGWPSPRVTWTKVSTGAAMTSTSHPRRFEVLTNGSLVIHTAQAQDGGTYACVASNSHGVDRVHVTLHVRAAPWIQMAAVNEASRDVTADVGDTVALECMARGSPAPRVTWILPDGTRLGPGSEEVHGGRVSVRGGGLTLHVRDVGMGDSGVYTCVAGNVAGMDSAAVWLHVLPLPPPPPGLRFRDMPDPNPHGPETHAWPADVTRIPRDEATLTVRPGTSVRMPCPSATPHAMRWVLPNGMHVHAMPDAAPDGNVAVFPNGTLLIRHVGPGDAGRYACMTSNPTGHTSRRTVVLSVPHAPASPAHITESSPPRTRVRQGGELRLRCVAYGDPQPRVLWRLPSRRLLDAGSSPDPRATMWSDGSLSVASVTQRDAGDYVCIARNTAGDDYVTLTVDVHADLPSPLPRIDLLGETRMRPGTPLQLPHTVADGERHVGITAVALETATPRPTSSSGHRAMAVATVDVNYGEAAVLLCRAAPADDALRDVMWTSPTRKAITAAAMSPPSKYRVHADGTLAVLNTQRADGGNYTCVARTHGGKTEKSTTWLRVTVHAPRIQRNPGADVVVTPGERVSIPCRAEGVPAPRVLWSVPRGVLLPAPWHSTRISIHTDGTLEIAEVREADTGWLECVALNVGGEDRMRVRLTVVDKPTWDLWDHLGVRDVAMDAVTATAGHTISLRCPGVTQGSPPLSTWTLPDGTALRTGQTHSRFSHGAAGVLHVSALTTADAGTYRCASGLTEGVIALEVEVARPDPADDPGTTPRVSRPQMPVVHATPGSTLRVACHTGTAEVTWQLPDGTRVTSSAARPPRVSVNVHGTLTLRGATARDAGVYRCVSGHSVVGSAYVRVH